jgi:hypothetical protein
MSQTKTAKVVGVLIQRERVSDGLPMRSASGAITVLPPKGLAQWRAVIDLEDGSKWEAASSAWPPRLRRRPFAHSIHVLTDGEF